MQITAATRASGTTWAEQAVPMRRCHCDVHHSGRLFISSNLIPNLSGTINKRVQAVKTSAPTQRRCGWAANAAFSAVLHALFCFTHMSMTRCVLCEHHNVVCYELGLSVESAALHPPPQLPRCLGMCRVQQHMQHGSHLEYRSAVCGCISMLRQQSECVLGSEVASAPLLAFAWNWIWRCALWHRMHATSAAASWLLWLLTTVLP